MNIQDKPIRILLDLDGVVADFGTGYKKVTGMDIRDVDAAEDKTLRQRLWNQFVDSGEFSRLPLLQDAQQLIDFLFGLLSTGKIAALEICTSAGGIPRYDDVKKLKEVWLEAFGLGHLPRHIVKVGSAKAKVIDDQYTDILIDDTERVLHHFIKAGGIGIRHTSAASTIISLKVLIPDV